MDSAQSSKAVIGVIYLHNQLQEFLLPEDLAKKAVSWF